MEKSQAIPEFASPEHRSPKATARSYVSRRDTESVSARLHCGVPFGIGKMFTLIPIGFGISGTVGVVALNIVLGGLVGGVILIYKLAVAVLHLPLTIYRLVA